MTLPAPLDNITPKSANTLVEQSVVHIDNELAALAESMRALRSRRNSLARISCLPPEILATVFKHIVGGEGLNNYTGNYHCPPCLKVTHVCGHWRRVALECPSLWAYIDWISPCWIVVMLERSKKAVLVVSCNASTLPRDSLERVLSQLPRIKVLRLHTYLSDIDRVLDHLSSQPAPLLQNFKFSVIGGDSHLASSPMSDTIFQGQAPQLRGVELTTRSVSWTSCIFSGLRTLYVRRIGSASSSTLPELLSALTRMPDLERLTLERLSISGGNNVVDRVPLARLKSIVLSVAIHTSVALFAHLALPDDAKIVLNLTEIEGHQNFSDLFSAMDAGSGKFGPVFRSLRVCLLSLSSVIQFSTSMEAKSPTSWNASDDDIRLSIQFAWNASTTIHSPIIFDICRMVTQGKIRSLSVSSSMIIQEPFWRAGSTSLPELEEIQISSSSIGDLLLTLQSQRDMGYRSLHALDLNDIDFQEHELPELHSTIIIRKKLGASLHRLRLASCRGLMADDVELFEEDVEYVDWDSYEEALESESEESYGGCHCPECRNPSSDASADYFF
ncbi:hypothetical protein K503DRAFT_796498 [Rhizopogon vinicolor AM-OR11-026]|uniref:Uncharacterized protein n=1 Tax=Rhizopogon vinicolor AM-OR11-026 TaxID=1314800 RepID=A0A1B7NEK3_9AGAM|nr:hypothetical protein K503DRAFT_796498 [Rhizopogon vinicolor AM-OR11-026]